jgi:hypothetical protein
MFWLKKARDTRAAVLLSREREGQTLKLRFRLA